MTTTLIIRRSDNDGLVIDVLEEGYNIIDKTLYDCGELAQQLLDKIQRSYQDEIQSIL